MANYIVSDTDLTSVANAIRTKGGTSAQLSFPTGYNTAIANISTGGAPTIVSGTFTTPSSGTQTVSIPYTGSGYPVVAFVVTANGLNKSDPFKSSTAYKTIGEWVLIKKYSDLKPNWTTSTMGYTYAENQCITHEIMKEGTRVSQMYSIFQDPNTTAAMTSLLPVGTNTGRCAKFISPTSLAIKIFTSNSAYGFMAEQEYQYWVMYSE